MPRLRANFVISVLTLFAWSLPALADLDDFDLGGTKPQSPSPSPATGKGPLTQPNLGAPRQPGVTPAAPATAPAKQNTSKEKRPAMGSNPPGGGGEHDSKQPINWTANRLFASKDKKVVDLLEDVVVTQGNVKLESESARVFFNDKNEVVKVIAKKIPNKKGEPEQGKDNANRDVRVTKAADLPKDRISARGNEAEFDNEKRTVTLRGRAALWRGGDVVRGKQIIYNLDNGMISVDSVEGVVQPNEQQQIQDKP